MDGIYTIYAVLAVAAVIYVGYYTRRLLRAKETGRLMRQFTQVMLVAGGLVLLGAALATVFGASQISDWGKVIGAFDLTILLMTLAVEGLGVGFRQMDTDGVGFIRFFQLGASIVLVLALAPAFYGYITYATRLQ